MKDLTIHLFREMQIWGLWIWKAVECFKWGLVSHSSRNLEEIGAECDLNSGDLAQKISEEKKVSDVSAWPRDYFCDILVKNVAIFVLV